MSELFRKETHEMQATPMHGDLMDPGGLGTWWWVTVSTALVFTLVVYLIVGTYTKRVTVSGVLLPRQGFVRIMPPIDGVVTQSFVQQGMAIHRGSTLFVITDERRLAGDTERAGAAVRTQLQARLDEEKLERGKALDLEYQTEASTRARLVQLGNEARALDREVHLSRDHLGTEKTNFERYRKLAAMHFLSDVGLSEKENAVTDLGARLADTQRARASLDADIEAANAELKQLPLRTAMQIATIDGQISALQQQIIENGERDQIAVTAPDDGTVASVLVQSGQSVRNQALATLVPAGARLHAELFVPSRWIGFVTPGQPVRLRYEAYPYQKFGQYDGTVVSVSSSQIDPTDIPPGIPRADAGQGVYKIIVDLGSQNVVAYGANRPLVSGMVVEASIMQDSRRLIEWIFEPLISVRGNVTG
ncbi:HlyD family secretion protein [Paraburkholderia caledonica]|uniref:Membrane fusion protein n=1 Tax=Paraburkholderia caledonica TaxID=134536 RepID=A0AB73ILM2_9BURK|nr:membrane fusion protein [Paraburkholderia caledonica]